MVVPAASTYCPADSVWCGKLTTGVNAGEYLRGLGTQAGADRENFGGVNFGPASLHYIRYLGTRYTFRQIIGAEAIGREFYISTPARRFLTTARD